MELIKEVCEVFSALLRNVSFSMGALAVGADPLFCKSCATSRDYKNAPCLARSFIRDDSTDV